MTTTPHIVDHVMLVKSFADARNDAFLSYLMAMAILHCQKLGSTQETRLQSSKSGAIVR